MGRNPVMVRQIKRAVRASILSYPKTFHARQIAANGTKLHVRVGGTGPAVVLLHGYGETGDMWVPLAKDLERDHITLSMARANEAVRRSLSHATDEVLRRIKMYDSVDAAATHAIKGA